MSERERSGQGGECGLGQLVVKVTVSVGKVMGSVQHWEGLGRLVVEVMGSALIDTRSVGGPRARNEGHGVSCGCQEVNLAAEVMRSSQ